ncbi:MAG: glycosyltransferase [Candidatus Omnitrophica bacterium]|nr:glycosyltransferase [Candidatus Omnitrophota bacterium]MCB9748180.1 glycosyltransferase [Candidatus Omnitrophota bacterium]
MSNIAIAIPCYNEQATIAKVIEDFRNVFPRAPIYVFNNNSTDQSKKIALKQGAVVYDVRRQGKGYVMQAIFEKIIADILIVVDGDDTYFAKDALKLIQPVIEEQADMVVGDRLLQADKGSFKRLNYLGNHLINQFVNMVFGTSFRDILSGYRVFSRRFIERIPLLTERFETETEMTLQALKKGMDIVSLPIQYKSRPAGSQTKLKPFKDGWCIILAVVIVLRDHYPLRTYGALGFVFIVLSGILNLINFCVSVSGKTWMWEGHIFGVTLVFIFLGILSLGFGVILNAINTYFQEQEQLVNRKINKNSVQTKDRDESEDSRISAVT